MMTVLKESVETANILLLVLKGTDTRVDASVMQMLMEMRALFGENMWSHLVVAVSFWWQFDIILLFLFFILNVEDVKLFYCWHCTLTKTGHFPNLLRKEETGNFTIKTQIAPFCGKFKIRKFFYGINLNSQKTMFNYCIAS